MAIHSVADVKTHLGVPDTQFDSVLGPIVSAIEAGAEAYTRRLLEQGTITSEKHVGDKRVYIDLRQSPVQSVTQLKIGGAIIAAGASSWEIDDAKAGRLYRPGGWDEPSNPGQRNIEVTYVAGFAPASPEMALLKVALVEWSAARFRLRNKVEFVTESFADHSATYFADMPGHTKMVLDAFKRVMS